MIDWPSLCPMCEPVGYPVNECPPCSRAYYCDRGQHSPIDDDEPTSPCRICSAAADTTQPGIND